ncbi:MnhB domain-containing protein [Alkalibacterium sp. MB6]|uniref:MnhB domain-containing protein n=1 Tax=Alkalibacterium sp. MB6 TaxID=2081965 RepID=UPI00137A696B|nr:MnhB domain-containing protein [Alkalibacterium sp. MB6]
MARQSNSYIHILRIVLAVVGAAVMLFVYLNHSEKLNTPLMDFFTDDFLAQTGADNAVAAIYLNYRVFDTLFEALMLMVSVMEVINVSWANKHSDRYQLEEDDMYYKNNSELVARMVGIVYPFVILLGLYIIANGHVSPGGGFQGGAILATALISRYLVYPNFDLDLHIIEKMEKILFLFIVLTPVLYVFMQIQPDNTVISHQVYMVFMNTLIGLKVFFGLSIIFYRFVFYEGADNTFIDR